MVISKMSAADVYKHIQNFILDCHPSMMQSRMVTNTNKASGVYPILSYKHPHNTFQKASNHHSYTPHNDHFIPHYTNSFLSPTSFSYTSPPYSSTHLKIGPLSRIEHEQLFQEVFTVSGHVEGDAVLAPQHLLSQLLCGL